MGDAEMNSSPQETDTDESDEKSLASHGLWPFWDATSRSGSSKTSVVSPKPPPDLEAARRQPRNTF